MTRSKLTRILAVTLTLAAAVAAAEPNVSITVEKDGRRESASSGKSGGNSCNCPSTGYSTT